MATDRGNARGREGRAEGLLRQGSHLFRVGAIFFPVIGVLILGAILQDDPPVEPALPASRSTGDVRAPVDSVLEVAADAPPIEPAFVPAAESSETTLLALERRTRADRRRLDVAGPGFTLQLATVCEPSNALRWVDRGGSAPELYLLATVHEARPCYRVCFGHFSRKSDADPAALPGSLREMAPNSRAVPTAQALR